MAIPKTTPARIQIQDGVAAGRLRPLPRQAHRRRRGRGDRADLPRRARDARRGGSPQGSGRDPLVRDAARAARQRRLGRLVRGRPARSLELPDRGLGRPRRLVPGRAAAEGRGGPGRPHERAVGGRGAPRRGRADGRAGARGACGTARREGVVGHLLGGRRPRARALRLVVRALPALLGRLRRRPQAAAALRRARLRRPLPAADPPDRAHEPQGPEQRRDGGEGRRRQPVGDRLRGGRARRDRPVPRHREGVPRPRRRSAGARHRDRARLRDPVLARTTRG